MEWMIYGANGYTGQMVLAEAIKRGHRPIVAGRNRDAIADLAQRYTLPARAFDLADSGTAGSALSGVGMVLHCAGPFSATCAPMLEACLKVGAHYLDITGEIDVFAHCHAQHERARERDIVVLPGSGFDVVPTDCLAAMLKRELPSARELVLAFEAGGGPSPGTAKTSVEGLGKGGRVRRDGQVVAVPLAYKDRTFNLDGQPRTTMTIPWGDVYTAYVSTEIPNVEVYMSVPPSTITRLRRMRWLRPLLGLTPVQNFLKSRVQKNVRGPSENKRANSRTHVWGEARDAQGVQAKLELDTPNGYEITVTAALGIIEHLLKQRVPGGYYTPSKLMGAEYVLSLPGVKLIRG
jgi:short subunit dehydrogenase-like uncharacterized protein